MCRSLLIHTSPEFGYCAVCCPCVLAYSRMFFCLFFSFYNRSMLTLFSPSFSLCFINVITFLHTISSFQVGLSFAWRIRLFLHQPAFLVIPFPRFTGTSFCLIISHFFHGPLEPFVESSDSFSFFPAVKVRNQKTC